MSPRAFTNGHLIYFSKLDSDDLGKYKCTITNNFDSSEKTVVIYEESGKVKFLVEQEKAVKPPPNDNFKIKIEILNKNDTSLTLLCNAGKTERKSF